MKKHILHIITALIFTSVSATVSGQSAPEARDAVIHKSGDALEVSFTVAAGRIPRDSKITLVPVLYDDSGNMLVMEPFAMAGRRKIISDSRAGVDGGFTVKTRGNAEFRYASSEQWREWMERVSLAVYMFGEGCVSRSDWPAATVASDRLIYHSVVPAFDRKRIVFEPAPEDLSVRNRLLRPYAEYGSRFDALADGQGEYAAVYFHLDKYDVEEGYHTNASALSEIAAALGIIHDDPLARLNRIFIAGYASPEGGLAANTALAQHRAVAVRDYLMRESGLGEDVFEIYNGGENWDGLRRMAESSDMPERNRVLRIIDGLDNGETRKSRLKHFAQGVPYSYMDRYIFPELRIAGYIRIYYDMDRGRNVSENMRAEILNLAIGMMERGLWRGALAELEKVAEDPRAFNPTGVCHMMLGNYDAAGMWFVKAVGAGDAFAAENLREMEAARSAAE